MAKVQTLDVSRETLSPGGLLRRYHLVTAAFFASVVLLLGAVVEMRRAIFLPSGDYLKVGGPSPILYLDWRQAPFLLAGIIGAWLSYRYLKGLERSANRASLRGAVNILAVAIMVFLSLDLFTYRGVPASRTVAAGKIGIGQAFAVTAFPDWLRPLAEALNYMALVWHATIIGILIAALVVLMTGRFLRPLLSGGGVKSHMAGALLATPYPFCSCCAAPVGASLFRGGASLGAMMAFVVSSPMLNITSLVLAVSLLPTEFALLRIVGGLAVALVVTYLASSIASRWVARAPATRADSPLLGLSARLLQGYTRLFRFEEATSASPDSVAAFVPMWLGTAWRLGRVLVPVLFLGALAASAVVGALPASPSNTVAGVVLASALGTVLMVPTWTEIAIALPLIQQGVAGPAAALLLTLPAVSLPCLAIVGGALNSQRAALVLGTLVFLGGVAAGFAFLT
ncbi:MAG: permease [Chloroflexi bacterium]|nr:permease [Chloroflexota bacterium]